MPDPTRLDIVEMDIAPVEVTQGGVQRHIEGRSPWRLAYERLRRDRAAMISLGIILLVVLLALFAPAISSLTGHGVNHQYRDTGLTPDGLPKGPGGSFLLGSDDQGRDVLVRIAYGARISLFVGVIATLITVGIGTVLGLAAAYFGGLIDTLVARVIDIVLSLPYLLFAIALVSVSHSGLRTVIMFIDILPNVAAQVIVYVTLLIPVTIIFEAALSFLGVGIPPPTADWGQMIAESQTIYQQAWWFLVFPSLALLITTVAFNIFGDGVRDALDPRIERL